MLLFQSIIKCTLCNLEFKLASLRRKSLLKIQKVLARRCLKYIFILFERKCSLLEILRQQLHLQKQGGSHYTPSEVLTQRVNYCLTWIQMLL